MPDATTRCCYCHRKLIRMRNQAWYHRHNASTSCYPGTGGRQASPVRTA
jgi:hypothetical protein